MTLTLRDLARAHLLELPVDSRAARPAKTRRWLLGRGVAAAMLPAIYSIVTPSPVAAQSPPPGPNAPTLASVSPDDGLPDETVAVTLTGTNFVVGGTKVIVGGGGVTVTNVVVSSTTSLTANFELDSAAPTGPHTVTVETKGGTSNGRPFTVNATPPPEPEAPTLTDVSPDEGLPAETVAVTLTGTNFIVGGTKVIVAGGGVTVNNVDVDSSTSLTADFVLSSNGAATPGDRSVTVTTADGTSGAVTFTINAPESGSQTFGFTNGPVDFEVPAGVTTLIVTARGAQGGQRPDAGSAGTGGSVTATLTVEPEETLTVRVGGQGGGDAPGGSGGFNGGGTGGNGSRPAAAAAARPTSAAAVMPWQIVCLSQAAAAAAPS